MDGRVEVVIVPDHELVEDSYSDEKCGFDQDVKIFLAFHFIMCWKKPELVRWMKGNILSDLRSRE